MEGNKLSYYRMLNRYREHLACPTCKESLESREGELYCTTCSRSYVIKEERVFFEQSALDNEESADAIILRMKNLFKARAPWIFTILYNTVSVFVNEGPKALIAKLPHEAVILNIGSGIFRIEERVINLDITPQTNVDLVASAYTLPFATNSVDFVMSESLLEHLERPEEAVREMHRVLKPGGTVYIVTPFMLGFHSSPHDFYRWTLPGMKLLLGGKGFEISESGIAVGPTGAFLAITREWLAMVLSFGSRTLYQLWILFFMIAFIPLNLFDYIISRYSYASQIAMAYYWIGRKT